MRPKSLDVSKTIDKAAGAEGSRGPMKRGGERLAGLENGQRDGQGTWGDEAGRDPFTYVPATDAAQRWSGWGTALKPAYEPIVVARKPLAGTVATNVLQYGTGALNIGACRVPTSEADKATINAKHAGMDVSVYERAPGASLNLSANPIPLKAAEAHDGGRWPTNLILTHSAVCADRCAPDCPAAELDRKSGESISRVGQPRAAVNGAGWGMTATGAEYADSGGASRYFPTFRYEAKAPTSERPVVWRHACECEHTSPAIPGGRCPACGVAFRREAHPTVKPLDLMRWLIRLVTPKGGLVLDFFAGTGTTGEAALLEGVRAILIEREADYLPLITARLDRRLDPVAYLRAQRAADAEPDLFSDHDG